jgi:hypothetical protein
MSLFRPLLSSLMASELVKKFPALWNPNIQHHVKEETK